MSSSLGHYAAMGVEDPGSFMDFTKKGIHPFTDYLTNAMDALQVWSFQNLLDLLPGSQRALETRLLKLYQGHVSPNSFVSL